MNSKHLVFWRIAHGPLLQWRVIHSRAGPQLCCRHTAPLPDSPKSRAPSMADAINAQESLSHVAFLVCLLVSAVLSLPHSLIHSHMCTYMQCVCFCTSGPPRWLSCKQSTCDAGGTGNLGSIPGSRRSPGGGQGNSLQYSCRENPVDTGAWPATVQGGLKESDTTEHTHTHIHTHTHTQQQQHLWGAGL